MAEMALLHDTSVGFAHKIERILNLNPRLESGEVNVASVATDVQVTVRRLQIRLDESASSFLHAFKTPDQYCKRRAPVGANMQVPAR
jgi:hypothetical protein